MKVFYLLLTFFVFPSYSQDIVGMDSDLANLAEVMVVSIQENSLDTFDLNNTFNDHPIVLCPSQQLRDPEYFYRIIGDEYTEEGRTITIGKFRTSDRYVKGVGISGGIAPNVSASFGPSRFRLQDPNRERGQNFGTRYRAGKGAALVINIGI